MRGSRVVIFSCVVETFSKTDFQFRFEDVFTLLYFFFFFHAITPLNMVQIYLNFHTSLEYRTLKLHTNYKRFRPFFAWLKSFHNRFVFVLTLVIFILITINVHHEKPQHIFYVLLIHFGNLLIFFTLIHIYITISLVSFFSRQHKFRLKFFYGTGTDGVWASQNFQKNSTVISSWCIELYNLQFMEYLTQWVH